jgi:hypothetical protein
MSHTISVGSPAHRIVGAQKEVIADVTQTSAYATSGEAITAAELGLNVIHSATAQFVTTVASATGTEVVPVIATGGGSLNLKFNTAAGESANASAANGTVIRVTVRGV